MNNNFASEALRYCQKKNIDNVFLVGSKETFGKDTKKLLNDLFLKNGIKIIGNYDMTKTNDSSFLIQTLGYYAGNYTNGMTVFITAEQKYNDNIFKALYAANYTLGNGWRIMSVTLDDIQISEIGGTYVYLFIYYFDLFLFLILLYRQVDICILVTILIQ